MTWPKVKLGDAATFVNGFAFKPSQWGPNGLEIIRIQNLTGSSKELNRFSGQIAEKYRVTKGDILISWSGTLGVYEWDREDGWLNQHIFKVVFDKLEFDKNYFKHLISSKLNEMQTQVHGATMKHITKGKFDNLQIPLPPLSTQRAIAERLDRADALRQKDRQLLQEYDALAEAVFVEMFGDPVRNEKWEVKNLNYFVRSGDKINYGVVQPGDDFPDGVPIIRVGNFEDQGINLEKIKKIDPQIEKNYKRSRIRGDELLIACVGSIGRVALADSRIKGFNIVRATARVPVNDSINRLYLYKYLQSDFVQQYFQKETRTVSQPTLNIKHIQETPILIPPKTLQKQFADLLINIEQQKALVRKQQAESEALFGRLLQEAFED